MLFLLEQLVLFNEVCNAFVHITHLFHVQYQSLEILPFWMINVNGVIGRLMKLVKNTYLSSAHGCSSEHRLAELILRHYL